MRDSTLNFKGDRKWAQESEMRESGGVKSSGTDISLHQLNMRIQNYA